MNRWTMHIKMIVTCDYCRNECVQPEDTWHTHLVKGVTSVTPMDFAPINSGGIFCGLKCLAAWAKEIVDATPY